MRALLTPLIVLFCLLGPATLYAGHGVALYGGLKPSEQETIDHVAQCAAHDIHPLVPSIGGTYALWITDHRTYHPEYQAQLNAGYDALASLIEHAHAAGIAVYPSITVYNSTELFALHPEWATRDRNGNPHGSGLAFSYPEARAAKIPLFLDLICNYDVDGIFVDYCRYPTPDYGFDQPIIDKCLNDYGFDPRNVYSGPQYEIFKQLRADSVTAFVGELKEAALRCKPDIRFGGFGGVNYENDAGNYGRDFIAWANQGHAEDIFLATYYEPINEKRANVQLIREAAPGAFIYACLCPYDSGTGTHLTTYDEMLQATREQLMGSADGIWIYREDALTDLGLWPAAAASAYKFWKIKDLPTETLLAYDASQASGDPTTVDPAWTVAGDAMIDAGDVLQQAATAGSTGNYASPIARSGLMTHDAGPYGYGIEFRVEPSQDIGATDDFGNLAVQWSDDQHTYRVGVDRDLDDAGPEITGVLRCGTGGQIVLAAEYDASKVSGQRPDQIATPWDVRGLGSDPSVVYDAGDYLAVRFADNDASQSSNAGDYGDWTSPFVPGLTMKRGGGAYRIEVKVRPVDDIKSTGHSYEYANMQIAWSDDVATYRVVFDKHSNDIPGTAGRVAYRKYPLSTLLANIDWSVPHTYAIEYDGVNNYFYHYLDGVHRLTSNADGFADGASTAAYQNRVAFGDSTTGGYHPDYNSDWYFVRLYAANEGVTPAIDWSQPHDIFIAYHNDDATFYFYQDGAPFEYIAAGDVQIGPRMPALQDRVAFGDFTTAPGDVTAQWSFLRVHDIDVCGNIDHPHPIADLHPDCVVDINDFAALAHSYGEDTRP